MNKDYGILSLDVIIRKQQDQIIIYEKALQDIITRSNTDPLGTSKVRDMRKLAEKALEDAKPK